MNAIIFNVQMREQHEDYLPIDGKGFRWAMPAVTGGHVQNNREGVFMA
jgi:hypothetical protein